MSALPFVANVAKLLFKYAYPPVSNILNRLYLQTSGGPMLDADALSLAEAAAAAWNFRLAPLVNDNLTLTSVEVTDLTNATAGQAVADVVHAGSGGAAPYLAPEECLVIKMITDYKFRGGHPRWYQCGVPIAGKLDDDTWLAATLDNFSAAFGNMIADLAAWSHGGVSGGQQAFINYYHGHTNVLNPSSNRYRAIPTPRITPQVFQVGSWSTNPLVCSQRRRDRTSG